MKTLLSALGLVCLLVACTDRAQQNELNQELQKLKTELETMKNDAKQASNHIATFLTFQQGDAEEAMNFYIGLFENSKVDTVQYWGEGAPNQGKVMHATFYLNGHLYMCSDSPAIHEWGFTPAVSNFVDCSSAEEQQRLFSALSENGKVMMPLNNYGFSQQFGFVEDKYGVSWQLNLR